MWPWDKPEKTYERAGWDQVAKEMLNNQRDHGLWVRILSETNGSIEKAEARYLKLRAQDVSLEMHNQAVHDANVALEKAAHDQKVAQEKADAEAAKIGWFILFSVLGGGVGWWLTDYTRSLYLGIAYAVVLACLPIYWCWVGGALSKAFTTSVILSAVLLYTVRDKLQIAVADVFFWTGIAVIGILFIPMLWLYKKIENGI